LTYRAENRWTFLVKTADLVIETRAFLAFVVWMLPFFSRLKIDKDINMTVFEQQKYFDI
jgi:hypothetical protein